MRTEARCYVADFEDGNRRNAVLEAGKDQQMDSLESPECVTLPTP